MKMKVYVIGTTMTNRLDYDVNVKASRSTRPASFPRGTFVFFRVPTMVEFHRWDRKSVHNVCTGTVMSESSIDRKSVV